MARAPAVSATRALQEWLQAQGVETVIVNGVARKLVVDGKMGNITSTAAKQDESPITKMIFDEIVRLSPVAPRARVSFPSTSNDPDRSVMEQLVRDECAARNVAFERVTQLIDHESGWNHASAISPTGAVGLMQLTSWPIRQWNVDHAVGKQYEQDERYDLRSNIVVGVWYVRRCAEFIGEDPSSTDPMVWARIYGAYNLGPGTMKLLLAGDYQNSNVQSSWRVQSNALKAGGIERYVSNAKSLFA
ncbi:P5 muramidase [Pseudomonas phage phi13]|uniref:p5 n=1 Tax=Pseudomonas phage phi13 TaxID=134554 RepID=Q9FZT9_9VIRU|nr:P5 muramidase [Pseudomonas phage phi13]AAG00437.1 P5 [Pseudomonas phage phi13]